MVTATKPSFISKDHQRALPLNEKDNASADSRLTKEDHTAPIANSGRVSSLSTHNTGSTRESKVQVAITKVSAQYADTLSELKAQIASLTSNQNSSVISPSPTNPTSNTSNTFHPSFETPARKSSDKSNSKEQDVEEIMIDTSSSDEMNSSNSTIQNTAASDTSFDPFKETIEISSSSSSSDGNLPFTFGDVTPSPFRKGYSEKFLFRKMNKL